MPKVSPAVAKWAGLVVALASVLASPAPSSPVAAASAMDREVLSPSPNLTLGIDPASWWTPTGGNVTLAATWAGAPPGCLLEPEWFRWAIAPGGTEGVVGPSNGSTAAFYATGQESGTTAVLVRAAASLTCRGNVTAVFGRASSSVTVAAPLDVDELGFATDPILPGGSTTLVGSVAGGLPPYRLRVAWGDGTVSTENVSAPGNFSFPHEYASAGTFSPTAVAVDSSGLSAEGTTGEPVYVSSGFAGAIVPSASVTEVGVPVTFRIVTENAPPNVSWQFSCPNAQPTVLGGPGGLGFRCSFDTPGVPEVTFEGNGSNESFPAATATLDEPVMPAPSAAFPSSPPQGEVGPTTYAPVEVAGGVPPFQLEWSLGGPGSTGVAAVASDGVDYLPLRADLAGTFVLSVVVLDAFDIASPAVAEVAAFAPALNASVSAAAGLTTGGIALNVSATVVEGAAPFAWSVVPSVPAENGSVAAGTLDSVGPFYWNATYRGEGSLRLTVAVVDAAGGCVVRNVTVVLVPALSVSAAVEPVSPGVVLLELTVSGGIGPFTYRWNDSAGDSWNGSTSSRGTTALRVSTAGSGNCSFGVVVTDALGESNSSRVYAELAGASVGAPAAGVEPVALLAVGVLVPGTAAVVLLRRRRPTAETAPPEPVAVLREVIEASDGVDRGLVELLAEERGVPLEVVRVTLERLKADGSVRSGRGSDGEEVLAWA